MFKKRTTIPIDNKYYIRKASGGYSDAIAGKPTQKGADVLANCVGYANGRFAEIQGKNKIEYQLVCNAERFIERAKELGLKISDKPTLGGIMCWQKGNTLSGQDGAGHVAIVEEIVDSNTILTSESNYGGKPFVNCTRHNTNKNWGLKSPYKFRGCIINPAVKDEPKKTDTKPAEKQPETKTKYSNGAESFDSKYKHGKAFSVSTIKGLNLRRKPVDGSIIVTMPFNARVMWYGFYTTVNGVVWRYVQYKKNGKTFEGFCSSKYLK